MSESKHCTGCGVVLQNTDKDLIGYSPKLENDLCQRCFRLKHYGDTTVIDQHGVESEDVLESVKNIEGKIVLMVDITDIESTLFRGIRRHLLNRELILIVSKRDLLPKTVSEQKILRTLQARVHDEAVEFVEAILISIHDQKSINNARKILLKHAEETNLIVMGYANTGKSSFLNKILESDFTVSPYANTTLKIQSAIFGNHLIYDTPGILMEASYFDFMTAKQQAQFSITKTLKPITYQLKGDQVFFIPNYADISIQVIGEGTATLYFSDECDVHRSKLGNRENYIDKHIQYPDKTYSLNFNLDEGRYDIVVKQLGWLSLKGDGFKIKTTSILKDGIVLRKAMI